MLIGPGRGDDRFGNLHNRVPEGKKSPAAPDANIDCTLAKQKRLTQPPVSAAHSTNRGRTKAMWLSMLEHEIVGSTCLPTAVRKFV